MTNKFIYTSMIVNNHLKKSKTMEKMKSRKIVFLFFFFYYLFITNPKLISQACNFISRVTIKILASM